MTVPPTTPATPPVPPTPPTPTTPPTPPTPPVPPTPADWYPDPQRPGTLRYWDGAAWTEHTAPLPQSAISATPAPRRGLSGGAIAAIVIGSVVVVFVIVGILAAIAIPVYANQKAKAADAAAKASVDALATEISLLPLDNPASATSITASGPLVLITAGDGTSRTAILGAGVHMGGYVVSDDATWCVWVYTPDGLHQNYQYSTWGELEQGNCSASG